MSQDWSKLHTKQLLAILHNYRVGYSFHASTGIPDADEAANAKAMIALKAELARRPHVPNKAEAKKIRQEAARRK